LSVRGDLAVRITKDPEVRRNELMDAAEQLFVEKGYEHTSASDIIRKVGVAQGTFYYYFKSKDEILNAVIDRYVERYMEFVESIAADGRMNALQKIQRIIDTLFSMSDQKRKFSQYLKLEEKVARHERFRGYIETAFLPLITQIVNQGISDGFFKVEHPEETTELIMVIVNHLNSNVRHIKDKKKLAVKAKVAGDLIEKALNAPRGSFRIKL
jgi:AcrR family transcriptional regulator